MSGFYWTSRVGPVSNILTMDLVFLLRTYFSSVHLRVVPHSILRLCLASLCFSLISRLGPWIGRFFKVFWIQWIWRCQVFLSGPCCLPSMWPFLSLLMWLFLVMHASIVVQCLLMILEFYGITWQQTGFTMPTGWFYGITFVTWLGLLWLLILTNFILAVESVPCTLVLSTILFTLNLYLVSTYGLSCIWFYNFTITFCRNLLLLSFKPKTWMVVHARVVLLHCS